MDGEFDGIATALSTALYRDGQQTNAANQNWGGYRLTNLGDASADTDALNRQAADARYVRTGADGAAALAAVLDEAVHATTDVASATTTDIGASATDRVRITGTTTITSLGTSANRLRFVHFAGALTLTHNATTLILPTGANITTAAGDAAVFSSDGSGNWRCLSYQPAGGYEPIDADILRSDVTSSLTVGYVSATFNAGTRSSGTFTPDPASGNFQYAVNGGAHTLAPPANNCTIIVQYTNNASAGTITTSGFTRVTGAPFTTVNGDDFMCVIIRNNGFTVLNVTALQ